MVSERTAEAQVSVKATRHAGRALFSEAETVRRILQPATWEVEVTCNVYAAPMPFGMVAVGIDPDARLALAKALRLVTQALEAAPFSDRVVPL